MLVRTCRVGFVVWGESLDGSAVHPSGEVSEGGADDEDCDETAEEAANDVTSEGGDGRGEEAEDGEEDEEEEVHCARGEGSEGWRLALREKEKKWREKSMKKKNTQNHKHPPSIINHQSSIINHQSSIVNHQVFIFFEVAIERRVFYETVSRSLVELQSQ